MTTNYIFVTGGVVSSLGKGIAAASLAAILEARGLNVTSMGKCSLQKTAQKPIWTWATMSVLSAPR